MNTLRFSTRQQMRTFVKRVNLCTGKKLFKSTSGKDGCGSWLALKTAKTNTLQAPSKPAKVQSLAFNVHGSAVVVTYKRSVAARMALIA
jgi:hypothetical protein